MLGRAAYETPYTLAQADALFYGGDNVPTRSEVMAAVLPYLDEQVARGVPLGSVTRHMLGLFAGQPGARAWRRHLSENVYREGAGVGVVQDALKFIPDAVLNERPAVSETRTEALS